MALSLVGGEAIALEATACTWGAAANQRQKRCTFGLAIRNQLSSTDLTTPTTFPQPPLGTSGLLPGFQAGVISSDPTLGTKTLDVKTAVQSDYVYARVNSQFRFVLVPYLGGVAVFAGPGQAGAPELVLRFRKP